MSKRKRLRRPCFVKVTLHKYGWITAIDDDGEEWNFHMHKTCASPIVSRRMRRFEMMDDWEKKDREQRKKARIAAFGGPRPVPDPAA